jgi:hypothetical protein
LETGQRGGFARILAGMSDKRPLRDIRDLSATELDAMARDAFAQAAEMHLSMGHVIAGTLGDGSAEIYQMARVHGADYAWPYKGRQPK